MKIVSSLKDTRNSSNNNIFAGSQRKNDAFPDQRITGLLPRFDPAGLPQPENFFDREFH
jgi:hypothetical protein